MQRFMVIGSNGYASFFLEALGHYRTVVSEDVTGLKCQIVTT